MLDAAIVPSETMALALAGLGAYPKTLPPKLFYDTEGVRLFNQITTLPEYYLTRTEAALLHRIAPELAALAPPGAALVEYGASGEDKAAFLLDVPGRPFRAYVPIDIAADALADLSARLAQSRPWLLVHPICADFLSPLTLPAALREQPRFGFFPGSTIGNLDPAAAIGFLAQASRTLGARAWMVVGVDLRKDPARLIPAYDDAQGITAAFNLNLLARLNREAGADFDISSFSHRAIWNETEGRIEMHLVSQIAQTVTISGTPISFATGETIHTENSYKHDPDGFARLAEKAGWRRETFFIDPAGLFSVQVLQAHD